MATPLARSPEPGGGQPRAVAAGPAATEYLMPAAMRGMRIQVAAAAGILAGLWVAISPLFIVLQHGGRNAATADLIVGLAAAGLGAGALVSPRGSGGFQLGSLLIGAWVIISPFILDAKFPIATPMYWSNIFAGGVLVVPTLAALAMVPRASR